MPAPAPQTGRPVSGGTAVVPAATLQAEQLTSGSAGVGPTTDPHPRCPPEAPPRFLYFGHTGTAAAAWRHRQQHVLTHSLNNAPA